MCVRVQVALKREGLDVSTWWHLITTQIDRMHQLELLFADELRRLAETVDSGAGAERSSAREAAALGPSPARARSSSGDVDGSASPPRRSSISGFNNQACCTSASGFTEPLRRPKPPRSASTNADSTTSCIAGRTAFLSSFEPIMHTVLGRSAQHDDVTDARSYAPVASSALSASFTAPAAPIAPSAPATLAADPTLPDLEAIAKLPAEQCRTALLALVAKSNGRQPPAGGGHAARAASWSLSPEAVPPAVQTKLNVPLACTGVTPLTVARTPSCSGGSGGSLLGEMLTRHDETSAAAASKLSQEFGEVRASNSLQL